MLLKILQKKCSFAYGFVRMIISWSYSKAMTLNLNYSSHPFGFQNAFKNPCQKSLIWARALNLRKRITTK
jgi:hypothetical protein